MHKSSLHTLSSGEQFMNLLAGKWIVQALASAAELGIADALDSPRSVPSLAEHLQCLPDPLLRLLRVLSGEGLLEELPSGDFALTELGQHLREGQQRQLARFVGSPSQWTPWTELTASIRTGDCAFERAHGQPLFSYLADRPQEARLYDEAVDAFTRQQALALAKLPVLDGVREVVDVGGGRGTLLLELLLQRPSLRGTLLDRDDVVKAASSRFEEAGLHSRFRALPGDFLQEPLPESDCFVIKHVLHNWNDDRAIALLHGCRRSLQPGGKILIVEGLRLPGNTRDLTRMMDLEMFVLTGSGRERSKPEFRALLGQAGLRLTSTAPLSLGAWLLVAEAR